jgi:hypothetical protein
VRGQTRVYAAEEWRQFCDDHGLQVIFADLPASLPSFVYRNVIVVTSYLLLAETCLIRLESHPRPHRNPDWTKVSGPHIHVYCEGYGDKWAHPIPTGRFLSIQDLYHTVLEFMGYCNVKTQPNLGRTYL